MKNRKETVFFAQRVEKQYVKRMETLAKRLKSTPRSILEICLEAHLPELEKKMNEGEMPFSEGQLVAVE